MANTAAGAEKDLNNGPGNANGSPFAGNHNEYGNDQTLNVPAQAFGGALQPGMWKPYEHRKFANPAPLGLCAFALTTFVLSCVNLQARGVSDPGIALPLAFGYGGLVQLLSGMW